MNAIIASRCFSKAGSTSNVVASIHNPKQISPNHWCCSISIKGDNIDIISSAYGVDSLQAVFLAMELISFEIRALCDQTLSFNGGSDLLVGLKSRPDSAI